MGEKDMCVELLEGPKDEVSPDVIRLRVRTTSEGHVGWVTLKGENVKPWSPQYRCVASTVGDRHGRFEDEGEGRSWWCRRMGDHRRERGQTVPRMRSSEVSEGNTLRCTKHRVSCFPPWSWQRGVHRNRYREVRSYRQVSTGVVWSMQVSSMIQ